MLLLILLALVMAFPAMAGAIPSEDEGMVRCGHRPRRSQNLGLTIWMAPVRIVS